MDGNHERHAREQSLEGRHRDGGRVPRLRSGRAQDAGFRPADVLDGCHVLRSGRFPGNRRRCPLRRVGVYRRARRHELLRRRQEPRRRRRRVGGAHRRGAEMRRRGRTRDFHQERPGTLVRAVQRGRGGAGRRKRDLAGDSRHVRDGGTCGLHRRGRRRVALRHGRYGRAGGLRGRHRGRGRRTGRAVTSWSRDRP